MPGKWDKLLKNTVIFQTVTTGPDSSGDSGKRTPSAGTTLRASVQAAEPGELVVHGGVESVVTHRLFFGAEPLDTSIGARPDGHCRTNDLFLWAKDPSNPSRIDTFYATGEAVDMAGWGRVWVVDAVLRS